MKFITIVTVLINCALINSQQCGVKPVENKYVVGGQSANHGDIPWQAHLKLNGQFMCGGSLLNERWVVTAAHCITSNTASQYQVTLGEWKQRTRDGSEQTFSVERLVVHPQWKGAQSGDFRNDVALLKLRGNAKLNQYVGTVCLPRADSNPNSDRGLISGWGKISANGGTSDTLLKVFLRIMTNQDCQSKFPRGTTINEGMVCGADPSKGGCNGDSGGPFSRKLPDGTWELTGIVSWTHQPCASHPTVFTRVSKFLSFINQHIGS